MLRALLFLVIFLAPFTGSVYAKVFNAQEYRLKNGLQVIVVENFRAPVVTHMVWYKAGAADEKPGKSGIAHFMEHLMFKGSGNEVFGVVGPGEFSKRVKAMGGNDNAFTSFDYTAYFQSVAAENLETVMRMEAGRMASLTPEESHVLSERDVILEERAQRTDNSPRAKFSESLMAALYVNHPRGTPIIGWRHEMEGLTRADATEWHEKFYAPNNAVLIVSGAVSGDDVLNLAQQTYGQIPARETYTRSYTSPPPLVGENKLIYKDMRVQEPLLYRVALAPGYQMNKDDALALQVLQEIFGNGATSRLYKSLVIDQKIASNVGMSYSSNAYDYGTLWLYGTPLPGKSLDDLSAAIDTEIQNLLNEGLIENELSDATQRLQDSAIFARDSLTGPAMVIGHAMMGGASLDDIETWPDQIEQITEDDVLRVAKSYLLPENTRTVTGHLLPKTESEAE